jgi:KaiC/GvpD/RAD55 family RecA-like ATPase
LKAWEEKKKEFTPMTDTSDQLPMPQRMPSGIAGLDRILQGGLLKGGSYLIMGPPGAGKTILGNQLCFNHVAAGGRAIYLTLLAETHSRMLAHIQTFTFFTLTPIADTLSYLSGYSILEQEGLEGLTALLRSEIRSHRATLLVIDGTLTAEQAAQSVQEWKKFLYDLNVAAEILGCTIFLIMQFKEGLASQPEQTMVDGLIELKIRAEDMRSFRELQVRKFRGSAFLEGGHHFAITQEGLVIHPRAEAVLAVSPTELPKPLATTQQPTRMGVGVTHLDEMLRGGLPSSSTTLLLGASGTGKTLLGCHFLTQGAAQGQKALYFGFNETPAQLTRKMERFSCQRRGHPDGHCSLLYHRSWCAWSPTGVWNEWGALARPLAMTTILGSMTSLTALSMASLQRWPGAGHCCKSIWLLPEYYLSPGLADRNTRIWPAAPYQPQEPEPKVGPVADRSYAQAAAHPGAAGLNCSSRS